MLPAGVFAGFVLDCEIVSRSDKLCCDFSNVCFPTLAKKLLNSLTFRFSSTPFPVNSGETLFAVAGISCLIVFHMGTVLPLSSSILFY